MHRSITLLSEAQETVIKFLIGSDDHELQKRGLQQLCAALESGSRPFARHTIIAHLNGLRFSPHPKVRRWLYKAYGLMELPEAREYLEFQITNGDNDAENVSWATSALFTVVEEKHARKIASRTFRFTETHLELSAQLFERSKYSPDSAQQLLLFDLENDPLSAKWYCLLFGYHRTDQRVGQSRFPSLDLVNAFTKHHEPEVSEYAIWALWRNRHASLKSLPFAPSLVLEMQNPGVRRWAYRLLAKTVASFRANKDILCHAIDIERDPHAREGLALALSKHFDHSLVEKFVSWFLSEKTVLVKVALLHHFSRFAHRSPMYEEMLVRILENRDAFVSVSPTLALALAGESTANAVRQAVARLHQIQQNGAQVNMNYYGDIHMKNQSKTVINRTRDGAISIESLNQGESHGQSARLNSENAGLTAEVLAALTKYQQTIEASEELTPADKQLAQSAAADIQAGVKQGNSAGRMLLRKGLLGLQAFSASIPKATAFITHTQELFQKVKGLLPT